MAALLDRLNCISCLYTHATTILYGQINTCCHTRAQNPTVVHFKTIHSHVLINVRNLNEKQHQYKSSVKN